MRKNLRSKTDSINEGDQQFSMDDPTEFSIKSLLLGANEEEDDDFWPGEPIFILPKLESWEKALQKIEQSKHNRK